MDFSNLDFTSFAGIAASTWGLLEALKWRFKWVDGIEEYLAVGLPVVVGVAMKLAHWGFVAGMDWKQLLAGAVMAGLASQVMHDKLGPGLSTAKDHAKSVWSWTKDMVTGK
jgi:hypothetical protein